MAPDQSIITDCIAGKAKAEYALFKHCYPYMMAICLRYTNQENEAQGVLNQAFHKVLKGLKRKPENIPFDPWARRITINTAIDTFRRAHKKLIVEVTYSDNMDVSAEGSTQNRGLETLKAADLKKLLRQLPPVTQRVFNLFAIDGYTHAEIAEMLTISAGTSKWHVADARKKLKGWINHLHGENG